MAVKLTSVLPDHGVPVLEGQGHLVRVLQGGHHPGQHDVLVLRGASSSLQKSTVWKCLAGRRGGEVLPEDVHKDNQCPNKAV